MSIQDQLEELLVDWEYHRQRGKELTVEELCKDNPELVLGLTQLISNFKATDWLEEDDDLDEDFLTRPDLSTVAGHADETSRLEISMSISEFCQRLINSELLNRSQVESARQSFSGDDARSFAQQLVSQKTLTRFQVLVLLTGKDLPLVLDRYVLIDEIGKGGMGAVYKALHQQMDRVVALKILPKETVDSPEKVLRFHREVKAAARLTHPNIVVAYDASESKGVHFLVMELVVGCDLADLIRKGGPISGARAVDYVVQTARGLQHAHALGIIHRDIKPSNLLLDKKGQVKILDMGLARFDQRESEHESAASMELTQPGIVMGTVAYLAPEQAVDTHLADARSDIYSLGCTLYYLLTGKVIYNEKTIIKTIVSHREGVIPSLCDARPDATEELNSVFSENGCQKTERSISEHGGSDLFFATA